MGDPTHKESGDSGDFSRVVRYFLDHEKPTVSKPKPRKRNAASKKPSTKTKKRA